MPNKRLPPTKRIDNEINALRYNLGEDAAPKDVFEAKQVPGTDGGQVMIVIILRKGG